MRDCAAEIENCLQRCLDFRREALPDVAPRPSPEPQGLHCPEALPTLACFSRWPLLACCPRVLPEAEPDITVLALRVMVGEALAETLEPLNLCSSSHSDLVNGATSSSSVLSACFLVVK